LAQNQKETIHEKETNLFMQMYYYLFFHPNINKPNE